MDVNEPLTLLAGLSPAQFMRKHWQKKPLLVRRAIPLFKPLLSRAALFKLATQDEVESRLIVQKAKGWKMQQGPLKASSFPPLSQKGWTLLVQSVDLHNVDAQELLQKFRFVPDARLDDLMISFASAGGGVGPHFDSYDVFLLQASGRRRWKISRQKDLSLQEGVPLKILQNFEPDEEFVLEAGDMLYLPPRYAHDGIAEVCSSDDSKPQDCMTYSIGFRAPGHAEIAAEMLHRLAEFADEATAPLDGGTSIVLPARMSRLYRDPSQAATAHPAALPEALTAFASKAVLDALKDPLALACVLGEYLTEPKASTWFDEPKQAWNPEETEFEHAAVTLDTRTRMMYDSAHVFINGESYRARGPDARLMQTLADARSLSALALRKASTPALALLADWHEAGWLHLAPESGT